MPERVAFRMNLNPGQAAEYKKRHDNISPEHVAALREAGVSDYSIWLDPETNHLFAILTRGDEQGMAAMREKDVIKRWRVFMADIMETNPDNSPVSVPLSQVFYLP
jgi:L-rhamnose mutarotase